MIYNAQVTFRYDETGLIWLLRGRPVLVLTESTAEVESTTGAVTVYRRHNKPALGPFGAPNSLLLLSSDGGDVVTVVCRHSPRTP